MRLALLFALACCLATAAALQRRADLEAGAESAGAEFGRGPLPGITVMLERSTREQIRADMARLRVVGFVWARQRLDWGTLEPEPGVIRQQQMDDLILGIVEGGMEPVLLLDGSPAWAWAEVDREGEEGRFAPPEDPADFARFAGTVAARYGDAVRYYQLWDEPNIAPHWGARHIDPVGYSRLLRAAAAAIRAEDGDAVILTGALAPTADRGHTAIDEVSFLQRMIAAGALDAVNGVDGVAVQPFGFGAAANDTRRRVDASNFQRVVWVRRALADAGYAEMPIWAMRMGWSTRLESPWRTVSPENQSAFAAEAFVLARGWPWLAGMGWAVDRPGLAATEPLWGFALTPQLESAIAAAIAEGGGLLCGGAEYARESWRVWVLIVAGFVAVGWRAYAAGRRLPLRKWLARTRELARWRLAMAWAALAAVYFVATWPPLIVLCWGAALWLTLATPRAALYLAAAALPFYFQHKELWVAGEVIRVPPAHLLALCLGVATVAAKRNGRAYDWGTGALIVGWLAVNALAALSVWHWAAYWQGWVELALVPVLLWCAALVWVDSPVTARRAALALAAGGALAALVGLAQWGMGVGTEADDVRRLVGPHFSPNHTALYLERCLFVGLGVAWAWGGRTRRIALGLCAVMGAALLLTGSRGALLLGVPGGAAVMVWGVWAAGRVNGTRERATARWKWGMAAAAVVIVAAIMAVGWLDRERLANSATIGERLAIWHAATRLAAAFPWTGVAPGGFYWRFAAFVEAGPGAVLVDPNLLHPHSVWLEFATFWGAAGLAWLLALLVWLGRRAIGMMQERPDALWRLQVGIAAGLAAGLLHGQVDAFWALADLAVWNGLALGLLAANAGRRPVQP